MVRSRASGSGGQPLVPMTGDKVVVDQIGIVAADAVDLLRLAGAEGLLGREAPEALEQALSAQDLVDPGDASAEMIGGVEDRRVGVGGGDRQPEEVRRDALP